MLAESTVDETIETDVLVIGGGIGGIFAALYASEGGARVVLLEKGDTRRSGAAGMGISVWHQLLAPGVTLDDVAKDITAIGRSFIGTLGYLPIMKGIINENLIYLGYRDNWEIIHSLERWGVKMKWDNGDYAFYSGPGRLDNIRFHGRNLKKDLSRALKRSAVTVLERTMGVDLLTKDGVIAGATAFNIRTGEFIVIKAKAVVLATGTISRIFNPFNVTALGRFRMLYTYHAGSGDGAAIAFRAGAELVNYEVGGTGAFSDGTRTEKVPFYLVKPGARLYDNMGNRLEWEDCLGGLNTHTQFRLEKEGRAPCFWDGAELPDEWHEGFLAEEWREDLKLHTRPDCQPITAKFLRDRGYDTRKDKIEIVHCKPEHNSIFAGVLYDEYGQTSVERLYAVGDMTGGSTFTGAAQASVFGMRAARHILANLNKLEQVPIHEEQVVAQREMIFSPGRVKRGVEPLEVEVKMRDIVERYCGPERSEGSINWGLWRLRQVRDRFLSELKARDNHELMSAQEVRNLFLMAEGYMVCARERKEGGMMNFRLDNPEKMNVPWGKAIIAQLENGEIKISRRRMPELRPEFRGK